MSLVQPGDAFLRGGQQRVVPIHVLARRIAPIGQQREVKVAPWARQVVDFKPLDLLLDVLKRGQQHRDRDQRAQVRGNSAT